MFVFDIYVDLRKAFFTSDDIIQQIARLFLYNSDYGAANGIYLSWCSLQSIFLLIVIKDAHKSANFSRIKLHADCTKGFLLLLGFQALKETAVANWAINLLFDSHKSCDSHTALGDKMLLSKHSCTPVYINLPFCTIASHYLVDLFLIYRSVSMMALV